MNNILKISDEDYTCLFIASDKASKKTQQCYINIVAVDTLLMVFAAAIGIYNYQSNLHKEIIYWISAIFLFISFCLTITLLTIKFEDLWYQGRALAESCKTLSWRFMTRSELFEDSVPLEEARRLFITQIKELGTKFSDLNKFMHTGHTNKPVITQLMLDVRNLTLPDRINYYIKNRIEDQKEWYSKKATLNFNLYITWFIIILLSQLLTLISILYLIYNPTTNWNFIGFFTTISASALSWLQLKRHQDLKQAYTTASQELNIIVSLADQVSNEQEFSRFVLDSENAISREHTLWFVQRRK